MILDELKEVNREIDVQEIKFIMLRQLPVSDQLEWLRDSMREQLVKYDELIGKTNRFLREGQSFVPRNRVREKGGTDERKTEIHSGKDRE